MEVTKLDRNLILRTMRHLAARAAEIDRRAAAAVRDGNLDQWKIEKAQADRVHRELRDLEAFRRRIELTLG